MRRPGRVARTALPQIRIIWHGAGQECNEAAANNAAKIHESHPRAVPDSGVAEQEQLVPAWVTERQLVRPVPFARQLSVRLRPGRKPTIRAHDTTTKAAAETVGKDDER
jgi:hypothetical protein